VKQEEVAVKKKKDKEVLNQLKARASEKETDVRNQAKKYRNDFSKQRRIVNCCPYCGGGLNESDTHLDHIYPVSKGGLSVQQNLVFVCSSCNSKKKNYTLRDFIERNGCLTSAPMEQLSLIA
jgi:5-methylcytosine-specific restriction endonuclease McrA